jgi:hypothetical protein
MDLLERRAVFVYDAARLAAQAANAPIVPSPWVEREEPFKRQFLEVIERQCGEFRSESPAELHGSWMQAYFEMILDDRAEDAVFILLCEIARQLIGADDESAELSEQSVG